MVASSRSGSCRISVTAEESADPVSGEWDQICRYWAFTGEPLPLSVGWGAFRRGMATPASASQPFEMRLQR